MAPTAVADPETGEVIQDQLFIFEDKLPDASRHTVTGSFSQEEDSHNPLPDWKLDQRVVLRVVGVVTKVNHVRMKDGTMERQHVIVLEDASVAK